MKTNTKLKITLAILLSLAIPTMGLPLSAKVPQSEEEVKLSYAPVVKAAAPAVVNVYVRQRVKQFQSPLMNDPFFRRFFGLKGQPRQRMQNSLGSGVILRPNGIVVTNYHVIKGGENGEIKVALHDNREFNAKIILTDKDTDLAFLKIDAPKGEGFPFLKFQDSDQISVGDLVLAIGNPFGVGQTVTSGIVSALARTRVGTSDFQSFIQTDAAINPGNSGGALVDMNGNLIGINTAIFSRSGGSNGIGFAIPSNMVRLVLKSALQGRRVKRPWFGARMQDLNSDLALSLGLDRPVGALITTIYEASPADLGGLKNGDVILKVEDHDVRNQREFHFRFATLELGKKANLTIFRNGKKKTIDVSLIPAPFTPKANEKLITGVNPLSGAQIANLSPGLAEEMDIDDVEGVIITKMDPRSYAARFGFRPNDILISVNATPMLSVGEVLRQMSTNPRLWQIKFKRGRRILQRNIAGR